MLLSSGLLTGIGHASAQDAAGQLEFEVVVAIATGAGEQGIAHRGQVTVRRLAGKGLIGRGHSPGFVRQTAEGGATAADARAVELDRSEERRVG